jgi:hypothetical protein
MSKLKITELTYSTFETMEEKWSQCVISSEANALFSSWVWQKTWWDIWRPRLNLELFLLGIYEGSKLIGIVPCYTHKVKSRVGVTFTRCEFIGNYSSNDDSIRSEYLNFILPKGRYVEILPLIMRFLTTQKVDELVLTDVDDMSATAIYVDDKYPDGYKTQENGVRIKTDESFSSYLAKLGKNTRLKLFNRRKLLKNPELLELNGTKNINEFFELLNTMHVSRWGVHCFSSHSLCFHNRIAEFYLSKGCLSALILLDDGVPMAVCYDITVENTTYNIQLGFSSYVGNKVSLGTLMLGYAIERAHSDPLVEYYDLLAGKGKNTFYKKQFCGDIKTFSTLYLPLSLSSKVRYLLKQHLRKVKCLLKSTSSKMVEIKNNRFRENS